MGGLAEPKEEWGREHNAQASSVTTNAIVQPEWETHERNGGAEQKPAVKN